MKKYIVEVSETAELDLENIITYLRYNLAGDIIADKFKLLFMQEIKRLEYTAGSMPILSEDNIYVPVPIGFTASGATGVLDGQ